MGILSLVPRMDKDIIKDAIAKLMDIIVNGGLHFGDKNRGDDNCQDYQRESGTWFVEEIRGYKDRALQR